ncbi:type IV secretory system conjugative DNA transfer family protein [Kitasatospora sp. NPDC051984]|uniref:type IV secretory system conjugative DNA transfer family protein n=1 Tax=Kitasatospora sp. NPDC051984 TaxID=3364059 RepID=UPI0037C5907B
MSIDLHLEPIEDEILEGELLDDDDPGPRPAERDPWWRRQLDHLPVGLRVLATERGAWLFVTEDHLTDRAVALHILNERHRVWEQTRTAEHSTLAGRAKQQLAAANTSGAAAQAQGITPAGHTAAKRAELAARTAAAQWEQKAAAVLALTYTGHAPVTPNEIGDHRLRMSHRRRIRLALLVLGTYGLPGLLGGLPVLTVEGVATGAAVALAAWGKSALPQWRSGRRAEPDLAYPLPDDGLLIAPADESATGNQAAAPGDAGSASAAVPAPSGDPYPIRQVQSVQQAAECIHLALLAEGLAVGQVTDVTQERWGWRAIAHLTKGKPADLVAKIANLDVLLGVRQGGVMPQPQKAAAGSVVLRIVTGDPFDPMPPHPVYPPRSNSILRPMVLGPSMDGEPTRITLAGQNVMVIAVPGGGKSQIVRSMADYITSCTDAIVIDIDPTGRGLGPLRRLAAQRAYDEERIDDVLDWAIREAELRTERMGDDVDNWQVDDENPAVFVLVDEHPQLTKEQKQKVIKLGRIGRKARVTVILLSQDATSEVVGDAIADVFGIRIMLPARKADVPLVVGSDTAISEGWMPHRLTPSPGDWDPADAGVFYIIAPGMRDPILRKATHLDAATATRRCEERLAAAAQARPEEPTENDPVDLTKPATEELTEEDWEILTATVDGFGKQLNVLCRQVAEALQTQDAERWADANATTVGEVFRRAGVFRKTVRVSGLQPSTGAALEDVRALLADRTA